MGSCLRCGADSSWIKGRVPVRPRDEEVRDLRSEVASLRAENASLRERVTVLERVHRAANDAVNGVGDPRWQYPLVLALQDAAKSAENGAGGG